MTILATRPTVDTTPRLIASNAVDPLGPAGVSDAGTRSFWIQNLTGTAIVYLDGTNAVTAAAGVQWNGANGNDLFVELEPGEELWGVLAASQPTQQLHALRQGR